MHYYLLLLVLLFSCSGLTQEDNLFHLYIGTYGETADEGIEIYSFNANNGRLKYLSTAENICAASYLAIHPSRNFIYAVNELDEYHGRESGSLTSLKRDSLTGELEVINEQASGGAAPCYVSVDQTGKFAFAANYNGGNFAMFPINEDGSLAPLTDLYQNKGLSVNPKRQLAPHPHTTVLDPSNRFVLASDLGTDEIKTFDLQLDSGRLTATEPRVWKTFPGSGPRHLVIHPNKKFVYIGMELSATISTCTYDAATGTIMKEIGSTPSLPLEYAGSKSIADIHISKDGRFLYVSNRGGHNSIGIFAIDQESGLLTGVTHVPTLGDHPRNFVIDPTGNFLLVANKKSNNVVVFKVDKHTGGLKFTGNEIIVTRPVCLEMVPVISTP